MEKEQKKNLKEMEQTDLAAFFTALGEKPYRAKQVEKWLLRGACSFDEMSDLPAALRETLKRCAEISCLSVKALQRAKDGTRKYLFGLVDGNAIESVFMKYEFGNTICISSQAGCRMGCVFCASGKSGLARSLTAAEMEDQILMVRRDAGEEISRVVVMGTGEPFDNYEELAKFLHRINRKGGLSIGMRSITISTCGLIPEIRKFAEDFPQVNLAVSLHAAEDEARRKIMPIAGKYPLRNLLDACRDYTEKTGRRITFEYALIAGQNDHLEQADKLAALLRGKLCHVNLIPLNSVAETDLLPTEREAAKRFCALLEKRGIRATIRRELGGDIDAACGQLRLGRTGNLAEK